MAAIKSRREQRPPGAPPKAKATGAALSHTRLPPSFQKPSTSSTPLPHSHGYGPTPVTGSTPSAARGEEGLLSEAQQQLQKLLAKQLDTSQSSLESALSGARDFTPAVVYQPLANEMRGLHTLSQFVAKEEEVDKVDRLRQLGLTEQEIELKLQEECTDDLPSSVKKRKLGAEPTAQQDRIDAVNQKILEREKMLVEPTKYHGVKPISRHAMDVERSLFRGSDSGNPLDHLTQEERGTHEIAYPKSIMPTTSLPRDPAHTDDPPPPTRLPVQVIERNRLTEAEIRALPRFTGYSPGEPSKVLYLKNLDSRLSADDLRALFGGDDSSGPNIRLMTGRMRGQAFVTFESIDAATKALHLVNGYKVRDKAIIISFGRSS